MMKQIALALSLSTVAGAADAQLGYLTTSRDTIVTSGTGLCWHTSAWTPARAVVPCDPVPKVEAPAPVAVAPQPKPEPKPEMIAPAPPPKPIAQAPAPAAPVIKHMTLSTEVLFAFDSATLRPQGKEKLDELAKDIQGADLENVAAVGHADRIGPERYNLDLSQERARAVEDYLADLGIDPKRVQVAGKGESEPVTGDKCAALRGDALIACLLADRRVEIEVRGYRKVAR